MEYKFFHIPALWPADGEAALNAFLARHAIQTVDRQFISAGSQSAWSLCVAYEPRLSSDGVKQTKARKGSIDYREVLSANDFDVFSELRRLRKQRAEEQAVPPYAVFSNEQLAAMVTGRVRTPSELRSIDGIGQARCEHYGEAFLKLLSRLQSGEGDHLGAESEAGTDGPR